MASFSIKDRLSGISRDLILFIPAIAAIGFSDSIFNAVFNNFLNESFEMNSFYRTFLELPREMAGFLVVFVSAILFFLCSRRLAFASILIGGVGLVLMALFSFNLHIMFIWLFLFSLGQHIFMPLYSSIGMELAHEGKTGKRLGQLNAIRNFVMVLGSFFVFLGFKYFHMNFMIAFLIAAFFYFLASIFLFSMEKVKTQPAATHLKLRKEYRLFYWLVILWGTRKQIFLTFAPWVLVTVFNQPTVMIATLLTIAGISGIIFQPLLGKAIDSLGEKAVLASEAFLLIFVCIGYGYARSFFTENVAFIIASVCFIADQLLMSVNMARSTYLKKIAIDPSHVTPTLTLAVSLDHVFSISIALLGGLLWTTFGYKIVFLCGAGIAVLNFCSALLIKVPVKANPVINSIKV
jgi:predicted MFS family arabinose efflux permease